MTFRIIKPSLYTDPWFEPLSPYSKLLFLYLCTGPLSNMIGLFQVSDRRIAQDITLPMDSLPEAIKPLMAAGKVHRLPDGWTLVVNAFKHQVFGGGGEKTVRHAMGLAAQCDNVELKNHFIVNYRRYRYLRRGMQGVSKGYARGIITKPGPRPGPGPEKIQTKTAPDGAFLAFYEAYPNKTDKQEAGEVWHRLNPSPDLIVEVMAGLGRAVASEKWQEDGGKYIPSPARWLRRKKWQDEYAPRKDAWKY
mgnify:CR=1 FL=1